MVDTNQTAVWLSLLTAVVSFLLMRRLTRGAAPVAAGAGTGSTTEGGEDLLLKFVVDETGQRKGETVAVEGDRVVLKTPEGFALLARTQLEVQGDALKVASSADWVAARQEGDAWRTRSHKEITYTADELPKDEA